MVTKKEGVALDDGLQGFSSSAVGFTIGWWVVIDPGWGQLGKPTDFIRLLFKLDGREPPGDHTVMRYEWVGGPDGQLLFPIYWSGQSMQPTDIAQSIITHLICPLHAVCRQKQNNHHSTPPPSGDISSSTQNHITFFVLLRLHEVPPDWPTRCRYRIWSQPRARPPPASIVTSDGELGWPALRANWNPSNWFESILALIDCLWLHFPRSRYPNSPQIQASEATTVCQQ